MTLPNKDGYKVANSRATRSPARQTHTDTNESSKSNETHDSNPLTSQVDPTSSPASSSSSSSCQSISPLTPVQVGLTNCCYRNHALSLAQMLERTQQNEKLSPEQLMVKKQALLQHPFFALTITKLEQVKPPFLTLIGKKPDLVRFDSLDMNGSFELNLTKTEEAQISEEDRRVAVAKLSSLRSRYQKELDKITRFCDDLQKQLHRLLAEHSKTRMISDNEINLRVDDLRSRFNKLKTELSQHILKLATDIKSSLIPERKKETNFLSSDLVGSVDPKQTNRGTPIGTINTINNNAKSIATSAMKKQTSKRPNEASDTQIKLENPPSKRERLDATHQDNPNLRRFTSNEAVFHSNSAQSVLNSNSFPDDRISENDPEIQKKKKLLLKKKLLQNQQAKQENMQLAAPEITQLEELEQRRNNAQVALKNKLNSQLALLAGLPGGLPAMRMLPTKRLLVAAPPPDPNALLRNTSAHANSMISLSLTEGQVDSSSSQIC